MGRAGSNQYRSQTIGDMVGGKSGFRPVQASDQWSHRGEGVRNLRHVDVFRITT